MFSFRKKTLTNNPPTTRIKKITRLDYIMYMPQVLIDDVWIDLNKWCMLLPDAQKRIDLYLHKEIVEYIKYP